MTSKKVLLAFLLCFSPGMLFAEEYKVFTGKVVSVHDGDTIKVLSLVNNKVYVIRLLEIDAPEVNPKQDWGIEARDYLKSLVINKTVKIKWTKQDKYGRTLGLVYLPDFVQVGQDYNVNAHMVLNGDAWVYREFPHDKELEAHENFAKSIKTGLWSKPNPIYPSEFRKEHK